MKLHSTTDAKRLAAAVRRRMRRDGTTQGELAVWLESTQGHVSKLLRGKFKRASRVTRALVQYAAGRELSSPRTSREVLTPNEIRVLRGVRDVAHGDEAKLNLLSEVLDLVARLQERS